MNAQTPPGSRAADSFMALPTSDVEGTSVGMSANGATWDNAIVSSEGVTHDGCRRHLEARTSPGELPRPRSLSMAERDIAEELVSLLRCHLKSQGGDGQAEAQCEKLADAFRTAATLPPITKQSLSELDIQNIIGNIKLRHDVNFDKDLSFRPNNEGPKGQQKKRQSEKYWLALEAELHLYTCLLRRTPGHAHASVFFQRAQKRIPKVFETIHDVVKSLVPDRDHGRVDEHLDVRMLMQQIEKGVCDMVALVEWTARLLKEHCAPMRDHWVDLMVGLMRKGAASGDLALIVESLTELVGVLETMKLDVANHQIRNLKPLLIEDTVNYEKHYHLDRIVKQRSKVNFEAAQSWWATVIQSSRMPHTYPTNRPTRTKLDVFAQAVVSSICSQDTRRELPDTFYLDSDRLRALKLEIEDLAHFEICFSLFNQLRREYGHDAAISNATRSHLRSSLSAIMGDSVGHGSQAWSYNSESLSLEIYRQAHVIAGRSPFFDHSSLQILNERLRSLFYSAYVSHASILGAALQAQVLICVNKHTNSSPTELYNGLVALPSPTCTPPFIPTPTSTDTLPFHNNTPQDRLNDLSRRISHIILLHWRIWSPIAYIQDEESDAVMIASPPPQPAVTTSVKISAPQSPPPPPAPTCPTSSSDHDVQVVSMMKTGEPPESGSGYEGSVSDQARLP